MDVDHRITDQQQLDSESPPRAGMREGFGVLNLEPILRQRGAGVVRQKSRGVGCGGIVPAATSCREAEESRIASGQSGPGAQ